MRAGPTLLFARNEIRRRWPSLLGLTALIALVPIRNMGVVDTIHIAPVTTVNIAVLTAVVAVLGAFAIAINARRAPLAASLRTE